MSIDLKRANIIVQIKHNGYNLSNIMLKAVNSKWYQ